MSIQVNQKQVIRQQLRQLRRSLSSFQQESAARQLEQHLCQQPLFTSCQNLALYIPNDGEIDPHRVLQKALDLGKACYLPVLQSGSMLKFRRYRSGDKLINNRFGIPEPLEGKLHQPQEMDIVLLPLVGFDRYGGRLGMGGGFYDRSFAFKRDKESRDNLKLIGLAHHFQQVKDPLPVDDWDIPLNAIATDREFICYD
jgi:5-formyltetrahydrofolate cyclo-ligase